MKKTTLSTSGLAPHAGGTWPDRSQAPANIAEADAAAIATTRGVGLLNGLTGFM